MNKKFRGFRYRALIIMIIVMSLLFFFPKARVGYLMEWLVLCLWWNFCLWFLACINYSIKTIYPVSVKKMPKYLKKMCMYLYDSEKAPISLILVNYLMTAVYIFYTVLMFGLSIVGEKSYSNIIVWSYVGIGVFLLIMAYCTVYMDMFKVRFKRINKQNIRYYFYMNCNLTCKWPISTCIGTCKVIETYTYRGKLFVVVEMNDTGEIYNMLVFLVLYSILFQWVMV